MHVSDAAQATVDNYPGGAESLAPRVGLSAGILRNKVNPTCTTNHLTLAEANRIMSVTNDLQMLQAMAAEHSCALVPLGEQGGGESVMTHLLRLGITDGELTRTLHDAMADNIITSNEMSAITMSGLAVQRALIALIGRMRQCAGKGAAALS
jgi:hypothetical protein